MAESIQALRERRNALVTETRALLDNNPGNNWKEDHQKTYDEKMGEVERIDNSIDRLQRVMDAEAEKEFKNLGGRDERPGGGQRPEASAVVQIFHKWARNGERSLSVEEWQTVQAAMSANPGVNPEDGGYTVPTTLVGSVLEAQKAFGGMLEAADNINTAGGGPLSYPTTDGTGEEGEIVPENQSASDEDMKFGTKSLGAHKFSSKVVTVPFELLQDSAVDIEALVLGRLNMRLGRIKNRLFTVGTGVGQPMGAVTASALGKQGAVGAVPVFTYEDLVDLEHSVDPAYRDRGAFMFHDQALALIRKIKDTTGRPIYVPSLSDGSVGGAPARVNNRAISINQNMPVPAPGAKSILFGDLKTYKIRNVMAMTMFRFTDSAYTKKGQVGFLAWMRADGNLMDVGGAVKHFKHGAAA